MKFPQATEQTFINQPGVYLAKVYSVDYAKDKQGNKRKNKNGYEGCEITLRTKEGKEFKHIFWYGKGQFLLDNFLLKLGINNSKEEVEVTQAEGKKVWVALKEIKIVDSKRNPILNNKGYPKKYYEVHEFYTFISEEEVPTVSQNLLYEERKENIDSSVKSQQESSLSPKKGEWEVEKEDDLPF